MFYLYLEVCNINHIYFISNHIIYYHMESLDYVINIYTVRFKVAFYVIRFSDLHSRAANRIHILQFSGHR